MRMPAVKVSHPRLRPLREGSGNALRIALSSVVIAGGLSFLAAAPAQAASSISLSKSAPASALVGDPITYTLAASNPADSASDAQYNLSFRDVLPAGLTYSGPTKPSTFGEPKKIAEKDGLGAPTGRTILIWSNVADLPDASSVSLSFVATPDPITFPVGSTVSNSADAYVSSDERKLPEFDAAGDSVSLPSVTSAPDSADTAITALSISKSEPSSEAELVRGVHRETTVYTLNVTNNGENATDSVTVVDYLPAGLEFLGCGGVDNSAAGFEEYPGSLRLGAGQTPLPALECPAPTAVTTVLDPSGYPAGVYTRVEWTVGTLPAHGTEKITYRAGIPLRANVMPADGFVATANLDNNTGASTRETGSELSLTNYATAAGDYTGPTAPSTPSNVTDATKHTVTAEDLAIAKSVDDSNFIQGGVAKYTLKIRTSEYTTADGLVINDIMDDGLCPLGADAGAYTNLDPSTLPAECQPGAGNTPIGATITAVTKVDGSGSPDPSGSRFRITMTLDAPTEVAADGTVEVSYRARMRTSYSSGDEPTSAGDSYTNRVSLTGNTTPIADSPESGNQAVKDESSSTIHSGAPVLVKRIKANTAANHDCTGSTYTHDTETNPSDFFFTKGSRVCFEIAVAFPSTSSTRNPRLVDFLPDNLTYEPGSMTLAPSNDVTYALDQSAIDADFADGSAAFLPGATSGGKRFVDKGQTFALRFSAIVNSATTGAVDVKGNLAKFTWTDKNGGVSSTRDQVDFSVPPAPVAQIAKQVAPATAPTDLADTLSPVRQGDNVHYEVAVTNQGSADLGNDVPMMNATVWDVLPPGFDCSTLVYSTPIGQCFDPADAGKPDFAGNGSLSAIVWTISSIATGESATLAYDLKVPPGTAAGNTYTNTAHVTSFQTETNLSVSGETRLASHYPADNVDQGVDPADVDAPAAAASASISLPAVAVVKANATTVDETNNGLHDAVAGETVTYTYSAKVPALTTVYTGALADALPSELEVLSATAAYSAAGTSPAGAPLPTGFVLDATTGKLTFPSAWTNDGPTDALFEVTLTTRVKPGITLNNATRTNTAQFTSTMENPLFPLPNQKATSDIKIRRPAPSLTKSSSTSTPTAGEEITYTLEAANAAARPTLYDTVVTDCVPAGLSLVGGTISSGGTTEAGTGSGGNGCAVGATKITWKLDALVAGAANKAVLTYHVTVDPNSSGTQSYKNVADLVGSTLNDSDGANDSSREGVLTAGDTKTVTLAGATAGKAPATQSVIVGDRAEWTVTGTFPAGINFYDAVLTDSLPTGIDASTLATTGFSCVEQGTATDCGAPTSQVALDTVGQQVGWSLGNLASDPAVRVVSITFTAKVDITKTDNAVGKVWNNTSQVKWNLTDQTDPTRADDTFNAGSPESPSVTLTVQEPVLSIAKATSNSTPAPGDVFTYTVTVSNSNAANVTAAHHVKISDVVPEGVVVDESTISDGGIYDSGTRTISWTLAAPLAKNGVKPLTYKASLAASSTLTGSGLVNTAKIDSYSSLDANGRDYTGPSTTAKVTPDFPHVTVAKSVTGSAVAYAGESTTFKIVVTNDGSSPAYKTDVSDLLPKNWTYVSGTASVKIGADAPSALEPDDDAANPHTLNWNDLAPGGLASGATIEITYSAEPGVAALTDPGTGASVNHTNTASVRTEDSTGATGNKDGAYNGGPSSATAHIDRADLQITKSHTGSPVAGKAFSWTITVKNLGPDAGTGPISVVDTLPTQMTGFSASGSGWACGAATTTITCTRAGPVANSATLPVITVTGQVPADLASGTTLTNVADVSGHTYESVTSNNHATDGADVTTSADLEITKKLSGALVAGQNATYTIDVQNIGPSTSRGPITVTDDVPAGTTYVSANGGSTWSCDEAGGTVTCTRATDLLLGQSAPQITLVVKVPAGRTENVSNTATVTPTTSDPVSGNNKSTVAKVPTRNANLTIEKSVDDTLVAGEDGSYTIVVGNSGPSTATGVSILDQLPSYLTYVGSSSSDGWACSASGQDVSCDLSGSLGVGDSQTTSVSLTVHVAPDHIGAIVNTASASATEDPDGATDGDSNTPDRKSDLVLTKTHADGDVVAGGTIEYSLKVHNEGPSLSDGPIVITDSIPAGSGLTYASASGTGWTCSATTATVTCTHLTGLSDGADSTVKLTFDIASDAGPESFVNQASVHGPQEDPQPLNNNAGDPTVVVDKANVTITKKATVATVHAGANTTWKLVAHNDGLSDADDVSVSDSLPAGLTVVSAAGTGWACVINTDPITCTRDSIAAGDDAPAITLVTKVGSGVADGASITNASTVSTSTDETDDTDNSGEDTIAIDTSADLEITKTHTGTPIAGAKVVYPITVHNIGPSDAQGPITVTDHLPAGTTFVSYDGEWNCVPDGADVECTTDQTIVSGDDGPALTITVLTDSDTEGVDLVNKADVSSTTDDPDTSNNSTSHTVTPQGSADISVTKTHTGTATIGEELVFTLRAHNAGPSESRGIRITDELPDGLTFVSVAGSGWTCSAMVVDCTADAALAPDASSEPITVTVMVGAKAYPTVTNTAVVSADTDDPKTDNNHADDNVVVDPQVDLRIEKALEGPIKVGESATYVLTVHNAGPTEDPEAVTVTDQLPSGLTYVSASATGWSCSEDAGLVTCERLPGLSDGATETITLKVLVGPAAYPEVTNAAQVTSPTTDTDPDNNSSSVTERVKPAPYLSIAKTLGEHEGTSAIWKLTVTNKGLTTTEEPIIVLDRLPAGLSYVSATGVNWTCDSAGKLVTCTNPDQLDVGESTSVSLTTKITAGPGSSIVNVASVLSGGAGTEVVTTDSAVLETPPSSGALPNTGGSPLWMLGLGIAALIGGGLILNRRPRGKHLG